MELELLLRSALVDVSFRGNANADCEDKCSDNCQDSDGCDGDCGGDCEDSAS